ncbi:MAG: hypothetical protein OIF57_11015 [Marinobacterium sp.]|nr:hypothetical protein [Marinobacterium sp.]
MQITGTGQVSGSYAPSVSYSGVTTSTDLPATSPIPDPNKEQKEEEKRKLLSFEQALAELARMKENVREGRPAALDQEEKQRQPGLDAFNKAESDPDSQQAETVVDGMQRIRSTLGAQGFERNDVDAYLQAMKMPELQGQSDGAVERQLDRQEQLLEQQRQQQQIDNRLTDGQHTSASMFAGTPQDTAAVYSGITNPMVNNLLQGRIEIEPRQQTLTSLRDDILKMKAVLGG